MRYLPTINLWDKGIQDAISSGQLRLQAGQWVTCGNTNIKARFAGVSAGGSLYVAHEQGSPAANKIRFDNLRKGLRKVK